MRSRFDGVAKRFAIVIEWSGRNYCAYAPGLPGCVAAGSTRAHTRREMRDAIALHLEGMAEDGLRAPSPPLRAERKFAHPGV